MWIHEVAPERLAELFHHYHQALMPEMSKVPSSVTLEELRMLPLPDRARVPAVMLVMPV